VGGLRHKAVHTGTTCCRRLFTPGGIFAKTNSTHFVTDFWIAENTEVITHHHVCLWNPTYSALCGRDFHMRGWLLFLMQGDLFLKPVHHDPRRTRSGEWFSCHGYCLPQPPASLVGHDPGLDCRPLWRLALTSKLLITQFLVEVDVQ
jgi:hypothetical protein